MKASKSTRKFHRWLGILLVLPCIVWALTGFLFHWKPGWSEAYSSLPIKQYTLQDDRDWLETRRLKTILGEHLLVRTEAGWLQWDQHADAPRAEPDDGDKRLLLQEAIAANLDRYGEISTIDGWSATTSTGVELNLDWSSLRISQRGRDTRRIDRLYKLHYLQWTGTDLGDRFLPFLGLFSLIVLSLLGLRMFRR
jgi:hypothetical protein